MAIDPERLLRYPIPEVRQRLARRDTILYALGVGLGDEPSDAKQLRFLREDGLLALPTMATALARSVGWMRAPDTGIDADRVVHSSQVMRIHRPIPIEGEIISRTRVTDIADKGPGRGAVITQERILFDGADNPLCTLEHVNFCRGAGGFGGSPGPARRVTAMPGRPPDVVDDRPTLPQQALIYRLSGDLEAMHVDPRAAQAAGYPRPLLHGLCTFGIAGYSVLRRCCDSEPKRLRAMEGRFTAPAYPGETIRTEIWRHGDALLFRSKAIERDTVVIDDGRAEISQST